MAASFGVAAAEVGGLAVAGVVVVEHLHQAVPSIIQDELENC
jgi:hypothetical protein